VVETREQQEGAILQVVRCFVDVLSAGTRTAEGDAMQTGGRCGRCCWGRATTSRLAGL
jgi:hypothetical protein